MTAEQDPLATRAQELLAVARAEGLDIDDELAQLPVGDHVARVGYLANRLGFDFGIAFDLAVDLPERRAS
jgi:hypothetical protein